MSNKPQDSQKLQNGERNAAHAKLIATSSTLSVPMPLRNLDAFRNYQNTLGSTFKRTSEYDSNVRIKEKMEEHERAKLNLEDLRMNLAGDVLVASGVTFAISPFTSIIDKAIVEQAAGKRTISSSIALSLSPMLRNPVTFLKSPTFLLMWAVYAATYTTANCLKTGMEYQESQLVRNMEAAKKDDKEYTASGQSVKIDRFNVFLCTTAVNSGFSILRDKVYAQVRTNAGSPFLKILTAMYEKPTPTFWLPCCTNH
jgi:hypothetical protein